MLNFFKTKEIELLPLGATSTGDVNPAPFVVGCHGITPARVAGNLHFNYPDNSPAKVQRIELIFTGISFVIAGKEENNLFPSANMVDNVTRKPYFKQSAILFQETEHEYTAMRREKFPFSFELPSSVPSTVKSQNAEVRYRLTATVCLYGRLMDTKKEIVTEVTIINYAHAMESVPAELLYRSSDEALALSLPPPLIERGYSWTCLFTPGNRYIGPSEKVTLDLSLNLPSDGDVMVRKISFGIKQYWRIANKYGLQKSWSKKYIASATCSDSAQLRGKSIAVKLEADMIPLMKDNVIHTCTIQHMMEVVHKVKVMVETAGGGVIKVDAPVFVMPVSLSELTMARNETGQVSSLPDVPPPAYNIDKTSVTTATADIKRF